MSTVAKALGCAQVLGIDRLDAQLILAWLLAQTRTWLLTHDDAALQTGQTKTLRSLFARRAAGEPLAYILGEKEFHGLMLQVDSNVLVPRPDTEIVVDWAIELLNGSLGATPGARVIDLGTGSGAIALAVKHRRPAAVVFATDASPAALAVAKGNAYRLGLEVAFALGSWWEPLEGRRFELILSNPPYIAGDDPHLAALHHEPRSALTPGGDGLEAIRAIVGRARDHLEPGGWILFEHGFDQADAVDELLREHDFSGIETRRDLGGQRRCTGGHR